MTNLIFFKDHAILLYIFDEWQVKIPQFCNDIDLKIFKKIKKDKGGLLS